MANNIYIYNIYIYGWHSFESLGAVTHDGTWYVAIPFDFKFASFFNDHVSNPSAAGGFTTKAFA